MRLTTFVWFLPVLFTSSRAAAQALDPGAARAQLRDGYALKGQGKCIEAIAHFVESIRLDRQPKTLLNLADCEEKLGKYVAAQTHIVEARDLARTQGAAQLKTLADQHLQSIETKMPKLVLRLAKDAPAGTVVLRDGVELGAVSLGTPLPVDPGAHTVFARGASMERQYEVTLADGATQELEISPAGGKPVAAPAAAKASASATAAPPQEPAAQSAHDAPAQVDTGTARRGPPILPIVFGGIGVAGGITAAVFGLKAKSKNDDGLAICPEVGCGAAAHEQAQPLFEDARSARTVAIVAGAVGGVALATGVILLFTGDSSKGGASALRVAPSFGTARVGVELGGGW